METLEHVKCDYSFEKNNQTLVNVRIYSVTKKTLKIIKAKIKR